MLKYSAKNYLLDAGLCRLCFADVESLPATIDRYREIDITFSNSRECNLLENITSALEAGDDQGFSEVVAQYDALSKLVRYASLTLCLTLFCVEQLENVNALVDQASSDCEKARRRRRR